MLVVAGAEVFERAINNPSTPIYTDISKFARLLGQGDKLALQLLATNVSGTSPTVTVAIEDSADGTNWAPKSTPISAQSIGAGAGGTADVRGYDTDSRPLFPLVRLKITLGGSSPSAHVQILAVSRDQ